MVCLDVERLDSENSDLDSEFAVVVRAAKYLSARSAGILFLTRGRFEIAQRRSAKDWAGKEKMSLGDQNGQRPCADLPAALHEVLSPGGPISSKSPASQSAAAAFLKANFDPPSNSFLLLTQVFQKCVVAVAFGFESESPPAAAVPGPIAERLHPAIFAAWSARRLGQLRDELRIVNQRLAGRKLVERAKALLQAELGLNEPQAYQYLRKNSRRRRITMAKLAEEVLRRGPVKSP